MKKLTKKEQEALESKLLSEVEEIKKHKEAVKFCVIKLLIDAEKWEDVFNVERIEDRLKLYLNDFTKIQGEMLLEDFYKIATIATDTIGLWGHSEFEWKKRTLWQVLLKIRAARKLQPMFENSRVTIYQCEFRQASSAYKYPRRAKGIDICFGSLEEGLKITGVKRMNFDLYPNKTQNIYEWTFSESAKKHILQVVEQYNSFSCPEI